ncbi:DUF4334 domain-containing protein [Leptospira sp. 85282-16]|uniref:DUF4334 domain-containing protein n=1 Tax=Leptospira montravelensis TaxID=2484961 RepID=A0ABY2LW84_9LEPT|nr:MULTISPECIES: DUF4334 domain-containing protein [Leptospira]MCT8335331.1 DUF4334 domain-containing protein [Leptospira sp. 85282-16]TGK78149.1 DUF4334 domain-containing protein [Leptospira montravelensis]TGL03805.1 DUF4334 domain-containing protein [Leptospira montravelensis]
MNTLESKFYEMRAKKNNSTEDSFALFDALETVTIEDMMGMWHGSGFHTGHTMDGALETFNWYGKEFEDADNVHPLVFKSFGKTLFKVNPSIMPVRLATLVPSTNLWPLKYVFLLVRFLFQTYKSKARVRRIEFRGKVTAAMIYDNLPIHDVFKKVNQNTMFGCMDYKGMKQPFFFVLERDK